MPLGRAINKAGSVDENNSERLIIIYFLMIFFRKSTNDCKTNLTDRYVKFQSVENCNKKNRYANRFKHKSILA